MLPPSNGVPRYLVAGRVDLPVGFSAKAGLNDGAALVAQLKTWGAGYKRLVPGNANPAWGSLRIGRLRLSHLLNEELLRAIPPSGRCFSVWNTTLLQFDVYAEGGRYPRDEKLENTWLIVDDASAGALLLGDTVLRPLADVLDMVLSL